MNKSTKLNENKIIDMIQYLIFLFEKQEHIETNYKIEKTEEEI